MGSDGFAYDGAAIYDQQARKYLRIYGDYPDERAHAEVAGREPTAESIIPADRFHVVSLDRGFVPCTPCGTTRPTAIMWTQTA